MPSRWAQVVIVVFWLLMTGWLVRRDLLPSLGYGELTYRSLLAERAVEEHTYWTMKIDDQPVGSITSTVRPHGDGSYSLVSLAHLRQSFLGDEEPDGPTGIRISSDFSINALGKLQRFQVRISVEDASLQFGVRGLVQDRQLTVSIDGLPMFSEPMVLPIEPEALMCDVFSSIDKLPDLRVGKSWSTRTINPFSTILSPGAWLGNSRPTIEVTRHEVRKTEPIIWNGTMWDCFLVEHRHSSMVARTWVRRQDDRVLRQEVPFGGWKITLELDSQWDHSN